MNDERKLLLKDCTHQSINKEKVMTITRGRDGIYCAICTINNKPHLGFSPIRQEAIDFCLELLREGVQE